MFVSLLTQEKKKKKKQETKSKDRKLTSEVIDLAMGLIRVSSDRINASLGVTLNDNVVKNLPA